MSHRGLGRIQTDPEATLRTRQALARLSNPDLLTLAENAIYIDDDGRLLLRLASGSLTQSASGLTTAQNIQTTASPTFAGLTLTGLAGFVFGTSGVLSGITNVCTVLNTSSTTAGNTAGGAATPLFTYTVPASTLATNGDSLEFMASGTFDATAATDKQIRVKFGATTILNTLSTTTGGIATDWTLRGTVMRTGAATQKCECSIVYTRGADVPTQTMDYVTAAETLSGTVDLKVTGEAANADNVVGEFWKVIKQPV